MLLTGIYAQMCDLCSHIQTYGHNIKQMLLLSCKDEEKLFSFNILNVSNILYCDTSILRRGIIGLYNKMLFSALNYCFPHLMNFHKIFFYIFTKNVIH